MLTIDSGVLVAVAGFVLLGVMFWIDRNSD